MISVRGLVFKERRGRENLTKRALLGITLILLVVCVVMLASSIQIAMLESRTLTVDDDGPADFQRIQDAVNAASAGDTVFVHNGTYYEHVAVGKSLTLAGEDRHATIIDGNLSGNGVQIGANNIRISGFTIRNGYEGILIQYSNGSTVSQNDIISSQFDGLVIENSKDNIVSDNLISFSSWDGVYLSNANNTKLQTNTITSNKIHGVSIENSYNNTVCNNALSNNTYIGIMLADSNNISVVGNTISDNKLAGINLFNAANSVFYHNNFFNNTEQTRNDGSTHTWDNGSEGNYWSDYSGTDSHSGTTQNETDSDGIGDIPYYIDTNNQDRYPLMGPIHFFEAGTSNGLSYNVNVISNSTVSKFYLREAEKTLGFNVAGEAGLGFCRVSIPDALVQNLWANQYKVLVDGQDPVLINNWKDKKNAYVYFTYLHSEHEVVIKTSNETLFVISIMSPENKTYEENSVPLTLVISEPTSWISYSLDRQTNVTIGGNTTLSELPNGPHNLVVYANNTDGVFGASERIYFSIETSQPEPQHEEPFPIWIAATIVVAVVGVTLIYFIIRKKSNSARAD